MNIASSKESGEQPTAETVVVRLAGDSGDGIQVIGSQLGLASAMAENDLGTFPEYPSEVRAPVGTTYGVCISAEGLSRP